MIVTEELLEAPEAPEAPGGGPWPRYPNGCCDGAPFFDFAVILDILGVSINGGTTKSSISFHF